MRPTPRLLFRPTQFRLGGGHEPFPSRHGPKHPIPFPKPALYHRVFGTLLGASMWFFVFYRFKQDGAVLMGWRHPWEH